MSTLLKKRHTDTNVIQLYGITEKKKAEIDAISGLVLDAQYDVQQLQAIVDSLTDKSQKFQTALAAADAERVHCLGNRNLLDQVVQQAFTVQSNSNVSFTETVLADARTKDVASGVKSLIDKLIYSAEVINKLAALVIRRKALNPLISDELVSRITAAGTDANNAVALTLVALQSSFTTQATSLESEAAASLEYTQAMQLYQTLTGIDPLNPVTDKTEIAKMAEGHLKGLIYTAYAAAEAAYNRAYKANTETTKQLNEASADLVTAQIKLKSLQAAYAAANAAALAS